MKDDADILIDHMNKLLELAELTRLLKALVERIEADQARLIEERAQLQDELQIAGRLVGGGSLIPADK
jgi:hypothetical protein